MSPSGFTLIELSIVIAIIGILIAFVLMVSFQGLEQARTRATQSLITKLNVAVEDRLESILSLQVVPNGSHRFLASINPNGFPAGSTYLPWGLQSDQRAQVIARLDQIKAELPDVFFIDPNFSPGGSPQGFYPLDFCGLPYPGPPITSNLGDFSGSPASYVLPLGNSVGPGYTPANHQPPYSPVDLDPDGDGNNNVGPGAGIGGVGTGIRGASYNAAASLFQLIGYTPLGYDGVDNDNNGFVDDYAEGTANPSGASGSQGQNPQAVANINTFLQNHRHKTARSEMLYALLVNGKGPLGSTFSREDFTGNEVKDTDNDGVPEFVDGWGEPLQFFRWPIYHSSPLQQGVDFYSGMSETRQTNSLDPNRQLTSLSWWGDPSNAPAMSAKAQSVQSYFTGLSEDFYAVTLSDPTAPSPVQGQLWERSSNPTASAFYAERAFFCKFLITSSGPDRIPGYFLLTDPTIAGQTAEQTSAAILAGQPNVFFPSTSAMPSEGRAALWDPDLAADPTVSNHTSPGDDDIDNQNTNARPGVIQ